MDTFFDSESPVMVFLSDAADLILANLFFLLTSLPLFTLGASTAALYSVVRTPGQKRYSASVFRNYFSAFARNFRKATLAFLLLLIPGALVAANGILVVFGLLEDSIPGYMLCGLSIFLFSFVWSYVFPLTAWFENGVFRTLANALILSVSHLPTTILVTALNLLPVLMLLFLTELFYKGIMLWIFLGFSLIAWVNSRLLERVFLRYLPKTTE